MMMGDAVAAFDALHEALASTDSRYRNYTRLPSDSVTHTVKRVNFLIFHTILTVIVPIVHVLSQWVIAAASSAVPAVFEHFPRKFGPQWC